MIVRREKVRSERNENMGRRNVCFLKPETGQERKYWLLFCRGDGNESIIRSGGMTLTFLIRPRLETTKKGFERPPFVIDYEKKGE